MSITFALRAARRMLRALPLSRTLITNTRKIRPAKIQGDMTNKIFDFTKLEYIQAIRLLAFVLVMLVVANLLSAFIQSL